MKGRIGCTGAGNAAGAVQPASCDRNTAWTWLYELRRPRPEELARALAETTRARILATLTESGYPPHPPLIEPLLENADAENICAAVVAGIQSILQAGHDFRGLALWLQLADTVLLRTDLLPVERAALLLQVSIAEMFSSARLDRLRTLCELATPYIETADNDALRLILASLRTHCELMSGRIQIALAIGKDGLHVAPMSDTDSPTRMTLRGALGIASLLANRVDDAVDFVTDHTPEIPLENLPAHLWLVSMGHRLVVLAVTGAQPREIEALSERIRNVSIPTQNHYSRSYLHYALGAAALLAGQPETALFHARTGRDFALSCHSAIGERTSTMLTIQALADLGRDTEALETLAANCDQWRHVGAHLLCASGALEAAALHLAAGDESRAQAALNSAHRALPIGEPLPCNLRRPEFVANLVRRLGSHPAQLGVEQRGVPAIRITTLGRFEVEIIGQPLYDRNWRGKRSKTLLKALIVLGGYKVSATQLSDLVWPDADGDLAQNSLKVALWRLRRLSPGDGAETPLWVAMRHGQVSLITGCCHVDSIDFEHALQDALGRRDPTALAEALSRYSADFLPQDDTPWIAAHRSRLRTMFHLGIQALAEIDIHAARRFDATGQMQHLRPAAPLDAQPLSPLRTGVTDL